MALIFLIAVPSAHVSMCMACAIGYSLGLPIDRYENRINKVVSFFAGGILFYTVYAGTTMLLLDWLGVGESSWGGGAIFTDPAWIYHTFINLALLAMFVTKKDRIEHVLAGIEIFMIGAPIMVVIERVFGRELWGSTRLIAGYVAVGLVLLLLHRAVAYLKPDFYVKALLATRKLIIVSLIIYTVLLLAIIPFTI